MIILDIMLPETDGIAFLEKIRLDDKYKEIPLITRINTIFKI